MNMPILPNSNQTAPRLRTASNSMRVCVTVALCALTLPSLTGCAGFLPKGKTLPSSSTVLPTEQKTNCPPSAKIKPEEKTPFKGGQTFTDSVALALGEDNWQILVERLTWGDRQYEQNARTYEACR